jgi:hypothetical protein
MRCMMPGTGPKKAGGGARLGGAGVYAALQRGKAAAPAEAVKRAEALDADAARIESCRAKMALESGKCELSELERAKAAVRKAERRYWRISHAYHRLHRERYSNDPLAEPSDAEVRARQAYDAARSESQLTD